MTTIILNNVNKSFEAGLYMRPAEFVVSIFPDKYKFNMQKGVGIF